MNLTNDLSTDNFLFFVFCFFFLSTSDGLDQQANDSFICSLSKSSHQLVYDLYALLTLTDAKGYAMMQFSWMLLRLYGKGMCYKQLRPTVEQRQEVNKRQRKPLFV